MGLKFRIQLPYTTEQRPWSRQVNTIFKSDQEIKVYKEWCREKIGTNSWNYYGKYQKIPCEFRFKREEDLLAFKLVFGL